MTEEEFKLVVEGFIARHRLKPTTFGLWAMNDSRFVFDLREGRSCSLATVGKIRKFMDEHHRKQEARQRRNPHEQHEQSLGSAAQTRSAGSSK